MRKLPDAGRKGWLPAERDAVFKAARSLGPQPYALVRWTYETASRVTESVHVRWEEIDLRERTVVINRLKGSAPTRPLPLSQELLGTLAKIRVDKSKVLFSGSCTCKDPAPNHTHKRPVAAASCPGKHLAQRTAHCWFKRSCTAAKLHPGLCHPHAARHARLYDLAEALTKRGMGAHEIFTRLAALSGIKSYDNLRIYLTSRSTEAEILNDLRFG